MKRRIPESVFLGREPLSKDCMNKVLVLGGDRLGREITNRLEREGYEAILAEDFAARSKSQENGQAPVSILDSVKGFVGGFTASFVTPDGVLTERVGHVIAAQPARVSARHSRYGLTRTDRTPSLSDLEAVLKTPERLPVRRQKWLHVAFLFGLEQESNPVVFSRVLSCIEHLCSIPHTQPYVFTKHLKVAGAGLDERYRNCRERGALFFKFDGTGPAVMEEEDGPRLQFVEPMLGMEMELVPDLLVVDEDLEPPDVTPLLEVVPTAILSSPFLQPDSPRFTGVETPKAGILAVGPSRGVFDPDVVASDIESVVAALKKDRYWLDKAAPEVDPSKCTLCLTCVRLCPHGAITFRDAAKIDPDSCVRCGICAAECPMQAITFRSVDDVDIIETIRDGVACMNTSPTIVAFLCSRSGAQAQEAWGRALSPAFLTIVVRCAGTVDLSHILAAFRHGADAVLVGGCFRGNCASVYGNVLGEQRVEHAREYLTQAGIDPSLVKFVSLAGNTPLRLLESLDELRAACRSRG